MKVKGVIIRIERSDRHRVCFNKTVAQFGLTVADLCKTANVGESAMSRFRSGSSDFLAGTMQDVIDAMPATAKAYYYALLMTEEDH